MDYKLLKKQELCIIFVFSTAPCTRSSEQKEIDAQGPRGHKWQNADLLLKMCDIWHGQQWT